MKHPLLALWGGLAFILAAGMVARLLMAPNDEVTAAWAQALGGMAAIGGAFWLGNNQYRQTQQLHQRRVETVHNAAITLLADLTGKMRGIHGHLTNGDSVHLLEFIDIFARQLEQTVTSIHSFPNNEIEIGQLFTI